jgi:hypothetical protein
MGSLDITCVLDSTGTPQGWDASVGTDSNSQSSSCLPASRFRKSAHFCGLLRARHRRHRRSAHRRQALFTSARISDGSVECCWGDNQFGQLGPAVPDGGSPLQLTPTRVSF